ncbi:MAG: zf-HC2 domain-containing protein [Bacteroidota bacterium]|nr:zf-HC2 domain-containing protein [Bacteroidota bacterium]
MSKRTCDFIRLRIPDYLDGKLSEAEVDAIRPHLASCRACSRALEQLRPLLQQQLPVAREEQEQIDWGRFSVALNAEIDRRDSMHRPVPARLAVLLPVAATLLAVVAIWFLIRPGGPAPDSAPAPAAPAYAVTIEYDELRGIAPEDVAGIAIADITITDIDGGDNTFVPGQQGETLIPADSVANRELRSALVDDIGYDAIVSATMEYFSTEAVIDAISDEDIALLASALEIQDNDVP